MKFSLNLAAPRHAIRRRLGLSLLFLCLVLLLAFGADVWRYQRLRFQRETFSNRLAKVRADETELRGRLKDLGREPTPQSVLGLKKEVAIANDILLLRSFSWNRFLTEMEQAVPPNVSIQRIQPRFADERVSVFGAAKGLSDLTAFIIALQAGPFEEVFLNDQRSLEGEVGFTIGFRYRFHSS